MTYPTAEFKGQNEQIRKLPHNKSIRDTTSTLRLAASRRSTGVTEGAAAPKTHAVVAENAASLRQYLTEWETLAADALEANVFYEPWMLLPAIQAYGANTNLIFVLVFIIDPADPARHPRLSGLFPLERRRCYKPVPATLFSLWKHPHCYLCTPLLKAEYARESLLALLDWLISEESCGALELKNVSGDGPFRELLDDCMNERGLSSFITENFARAFLRTAGHIDRYLQQTISGKGRRELKRKVNRLSEMGVLQYEELGPGGDADSWVEDFLQVEAMGWKGTKRTALACNERDRSFFKLIAAEAFEKGKLLIGALRLNNKTIAIQCGFFSGRGYFAFKSAFDEAYGHFSPGVLLLLEIISSAHRKDGLLWMDSCTTPDNFVANRLFAERRAIQAIFIATGRSGALLVSVMRFLRRIKERRRPHLIREPESGVVLQNEVSV